MSPQKILINMMQSMAEKWLSECGGGGGSDRSRLTFRAQLARQARRARHVLLPLRVRHSMLVRRARHALRARQARLIKRGAAGVAGAACH